jgi:hypothetical protein
LVPTTNKGAPNVAEIDLNKGLDESVGSEGHLSIRPLFPTNKGLPNVTEADLDMVSDNYLD